MNFLAVRALRHDLLQKRYEFLAGVTRSRFAMNTPRLSIQRGIERQRSVPVIFKALSLRTSWTERQHWIETIECLNRGLFIDAEHGRMLRRIQV